LIHTSSFFQRKYYDQYTVEYTGSEQEAARPGEAVTGPTAVSVDASDALRADTAAAKIACLRVEKPGPVPGFFAWKKPMDDRIKSWLVPPVLIPLVIVVGLAFLAVLSW